MAPLTLAEVFSMEASCSEDNMSCYLLSANCVLDIVTVVLTPWILSKIL